MNLKVDFNSRKFWLFAGIFIAGFLIYYFVISQYISASISDVANFNPASSGYDLAINISENGTVKTGDKKDSKALSVEKDYDLFKYVAYSQEGLYVDNLNIIINLPKPITKIADLNPRVYAVHGATEGTYKLVNSTTIVFSTYNLSPGSTYTVELEFPKGYIDMPWDKTLVYTMKNIPLAWWLVLGNVPLLIALIVLFYLYHLLSRDWNGIKTKDTLSSLPGDLGPAEAGVLVNGKISSRLVAAIMVDMARRGIIRIIDNEQYFSFSLTGKNTTNLKNYEKLLLDKLFTAQQKNINLEDIDLRIARHIFSRKIAQAYLDIYQEIDKKGYFLANIDRFQASYKRAGYMLFFFGIAGFIANMIYFSDIPYVLISWFSIVISSMFIIRLASRIPRRNATGLLETKKWVEFKNFLSLPKDFGYSFEAQSIYEKYLPYAVAFGCEEAWSKRFIRYPFNLPSWISTQKSVVKIEDILNEIVPLVDYISYKLSEIKEPTV